MSITATARYGLTPAPPGLNVVQDLLNTISIQTYGPDLLNTAESANGWLAAAVSGLEHPGIDHPLLAEADLPQLRALRDDLRAAVTGESATAQEITATIIIQDDGSITLAPKGVGWQWVSSLMWAQLLLARQLKIAQRLKTCHNPECGSAFYDKSKNSSGVWHDVKTCGNAANLRASRARKKAAHPG